MTKCTIAALAAALAAAAPSTALADAVTLKETGSTLILPLFQSWARDYAKNHPGVTITTEGTGSQKGIDAAIDGSTTIGTSDAFMSSEATSQHPGVLNIPLAISAQTVNYNLPNLTAPLRIDGPTLVGIYSGRIRSWDDAALIALNPGTSLPHHAIVPVHRADGSGDTFVFTQYLSFTTEQQVASGFFTEPASWEKDVGYGLTVAWPHVDGEVTATGNAGMVEMLGQTPYAIGYVGVSFADAIKDAALGTALVRGYSGQFLLPTRATVMAAAASLTPRTPADERLSLVNAPGEGCYPLINYEYVMVAKQQSSPEMTSALRDFLLWAAAPDEGNAHRLDTEHFIPLPPSIWVKTHDQIEAIR